VYEARKLGMGGRSVLVGETGLHTGDEQVRERASGKRPDYPHRSRAGRAPERSQLLPSLIRVSSSALPVRLIS